MKNCVVTVAVETWCCWLYCRTAKSTWTAVGGNNGTFRAYKSCTISEF